jgi:hypothetical protein
VNHELVHQTKFQGGISMQATYSVPKSPLTIAIMMSALLVAVLLGGVGGYAVKGVFSTPVERANSVLVDPLTGYPSGGTDDQRIVALLRQSGYEGGGTVVRPAVDPLTGYPSGSGDDVRILDMLKQSGYEGGGTVVQGGSAGGNRT